MGSFEMEMILFRSLDLSERSHTLGLGSGTNPILKYSCILQRHCDITCAYVKNNQSESYDLHKTKLHKNL